jgi:hypothetical protein
LQDLSSQQRSIASRVRIGGEVTDQYAGGKIGFAGAAAEGEDLPCKLCAVINLSLPDTILRNLQNLV